MENRNTTELPFWLCPECGKKISKSIKDCPYCRNNSKRNVATENRTPQSSSDKNELFEPCNTSKSSQVENDKSEDREITTSERFSINAVLFVIVFVILTGLEKFLSGAKYGSGMDLYYSAVVFQALVFGGFCSFIGNQKGRSAGNWFVLGFLFSIIALLALIAVPNEIKNSNASSN